MVRYSSALGALALTFGVHSAVLAQTALYHLHKEASGVVTTNKQLQPAGPDAAAIAFQTQNLKGQNGNFATHIAYFETQSNVPHTTGTIPANTIVTFALWMKKTNSNGTLYPYAVLYRNATNGGGFCAAGGQQTPVPPDPPTPPLTTTLTKYTIRCTTAAAITMAASDRFFIDVEVWSVGPTGNQNLFGELDIEGTGTGNCGAQNGNCDSTVIAPLPPPTITSLTPASGVAGQSVTIGGSAFRDTQGSSTITFNGTAATATSWSDTSIATTVPSSATTGSVVVTVNGAPSSGVGFTVLPHINSLTPGTAGWGQAVTVAGTGFGATQGTSTVTLNGAAMTPSNWTGAAIAFTVPQGAASGPVVVTVGGNASNSITLTVVTTGTVAGTITRATGGAALSGATVQAVLTGIVKGTATSAANGTYSIPTLDPGTYDVRVLATGFSSEVRSATNVAANVTTTINVAMYQPGSISGTVTQASGGAPISGAAVAVYLGSLQKGSTNTGANGNYSIANLHPGAYTVQAANVGNRTKEQGATISENANTTSNLALDVAPTGAVNYIYDELGRLVSVIDPSGDAAHYSYDKVGNILSIARAGASTVSISEFTPNSGPVGSSVTIYGTGFSTSSSNTVTFGAGQATAIADTANRLTVTVPANATSGAAIGVTSPLGSATSTATFTVTSAAAGAPTITGFSPAIWDGASALTISGTNFDTTPANDRVNLNVGFASPSVATASSLTVPVPASATSGHIVVATVAGTATSASDFFVPPPGYSSANLQSTGRLTVPGNDLLSLVAGKFAMRLFDGVAGHRVSAKFIDVSMIASATLYDPYGRPVRSVPVDSSDPFLDAVVVVPGTYTLLVSATSGGGATVTLYDIQDVTGTIIPDGSLKIASTSLAGQNALYSFTTSATARYSVLVGQNTLQGGVFLGDVRGQPLTTSAINIQDNLIEPMSLPAGTYTVGVDFSGSAHGNQNLHLYTVPADVSGTLTPTLGGAQASADLTIPGRNAVYTLGTPVNSRVSLLIAAGPMGGVTVLNGTTTVAFGNITAVATFIEPWTFAAGQTIKADPSGPSAGTVTVTAFDVPADTTGSVTVGGSAVAVPLTGAGQNGTLTFTPSANQQVTVHVTGNTFGMVTVSLLDNVGQTLASSGSLADTFNLSAASVAAGVPYTVRIDPFGSNTGTLNISVSNP